MRDIHTAITERFIEQLKQGTVPWQRPWLSSQNLVSRKAYRGINSLLLGSSRFDSPFWMTFRQAVELGGSVKKGEKASPVIYYKFLEKHDEKGHTVLTAKGVPKQIPFVRWSNVFNLNQIEGIQAPELEVSEARRPALEEAAGMVQRADLCPIHHRGFAAAYSPREDTVYMPAPGAFRSQEDYYHTLFHEMTHNAETGIMPHRAGIWRLCL